MNKHVTKLLEKQIWHLGTYDREPNVVPVLFKAVTEDGKLLVGDVFLETTLQNLQQNGKIAVSVCDTETLEGYQIKGHAQHLTEGPIVEKFKATVQEAFKGTIAAKGALVITPEQIIVTTPGPNNKKIVE